MLYKFCQALSTVATIATCAPEPITAELKPTTYLKKQADLYLQRRELDRESGPRLFGSEEIRRHALYKVESVDVRVLLAASS